MTFCTNCGHKITTKVNFCAQCGNSIINESVDTKIEYFIFQDTNSKKYGIKDNHGVVTCNAIFDEVGNVADRICNTLYGDNILKTTDQISARKDKKWGFINYKGEWTIHPIFDYVGHYFYNDLCGVIKNEKIGYINKIGEFIIQPVFDCNKVQLLEYLNTPDPDPWDTPTINNFDKHGFCIAQENGKFGFIDKSGNWIIQPNFNSVTDFVISGIYNFSIVSNSDNRFGLIDRKGIWLANPIYEDISIQSSDLDTYGFLGAELNDVIGKLWLTNDKGIFFEEDQFTEEEEEDDDDDDYLVNVKNTSQENKTSNAIANWVNQVAIAVICLVVLLGIVLFFNETILSKLNSFINGVEKINERASNIDFGQSESNKEENETADNSDVVKVIDWIDGNNYTYDYIETITQKADDGTLNTFTIYRKNKPNTSIHDCAEQKCKWCGKIYFAENYELKEIPNLKEMPNLNWIKENLNTNSLSPLGETIVGDIILGGIFENGELGNKLYYDLNNNKIRTDWIINCNYSNPYGFCSNKCNTEYNLYK